MKNETHQTLFYQAMMTGLFVGIVDTLILLVFNIFYRNYTGYHPSEIVNVSSLIFITNLLLLTVGLVYYVFLRTIGQGNAVFLVFVLALTAFLTWKSFNSHRFDDVRINQGWHGLLGGIVLILGLSSACIPLLFNNKKFLEKVI